MPSKDSYEYSAIIIFDFFYALSNLFCCNRTTRQKTIINVYALQL